jgi:hypothetical protein
MDSQVGVDAMSPLPQRGPTADKGIPDCLHLGAGAGKLRGMPYLGCNSLSPNPGTLSAFTLSTSPGVILAPDNPTPHRRPLPPWLLPYVLFPLRLQTDFKSNFQTMEQLLINPEV